MSHNPLHKIGQSIFPGGNPFYQEDEDTAKLRTRMLEASKPGPNQDLGLAASLKNEIEAQQTHDMQEYMNIAATAGASGGGTAVSHGRAMPYGDTAMFNPKAMPNPLSEEEDEYTKQLRAPGFATFGQQYMKPYRMYS